MSSISQKKAILELGSLSTRVRAQDSPRSFIGTAAESRTVQGQNIHEALKYHSVPYQQDETNLLGHDYLAVCYSPQQAGTSASPLFGLYDSTAGQNSVGHGPGLDRFDGLNVKNQAIRGPELEWIAKQVSSTEIVNQIPQAIETCNIMRGTNNPQVADLPRSCSYHGPIIRMESSNKFQQDGMSPMERFLQEGAFDQYALVIRADTGRISTARDCSCYMNGEWHNTGDEK